MGERNKPIIDNLRRAGKPIPDDRFPPVLRAGLSFFYEAFIALSSTRNHGTAPISWLSIEEYADRLGLTPEIRLDLHHHISALDQKFLAHQVKTGSKKGEDQGRHPPKGPPAKHPPRGRGGQ